MPTKGLQAAAERALFEARTVAADTGETLVRSDVVLAALAAQDPPSPLLGRLRAAVAAPSAAETESRPPGPPFDEEVLAAVAQARRFALLLAAERPGADHLLLGLLSERLSRSALAARAAGVVFEDAFRELTGWEHAPTGFTPAPLDVEPS